jgi:hypothetical protein
MINVRVDVTNPGEFFACCGLFELCDRLSPGCRACFTGDRTLQIVTGGDRPLPTLESVICDLHRVEFEPVAPDDPAATPLRLAAPFDVGLDWWIDQRSRGAELKTWAGQQKVTRIAAAMQATLLDDVVADDTLFHKSAVLYEPGSRTKTVEPFYFDARRAAQAHAVDIGFSPDTQQMEMPVYATTELLCLIGLQRFRPRVNDDRSRTYGVWSNPLPIVAASAVAACGAVMPATTRYRFHLLYRTKYLKGFLPSIPEGENR